LHNAHRQPPAADAPGTALGLIALLAPVLLLPGLAAGAGGRLRPADYPASWLAAARAVDASRAPGDVLLLPWAADRAPDWNHGETLLDPWPRLLSRRVIWNDGTRVGDVRLAPDDPQARRLDAIISSASPLTGPLQAAGVRFVIVDADPADAGAARTAARLPGSRAIVDEPGLAVYQLPG